MITLVGGDGAITNDVLQLLFMYSNLIVGGKDYLSIKTVVKNLRN